MACRKMNEDVAYALSGCKLLLEKPHFVVFALTSSFFDNRLIVRLHAFDTDTVHNRKTYFGSFKESTE